MIKINGDLKKKSFAVEVKGHAGFSEKGKDIVCAAVSALTDALWSTAEEFSDMKIFSSCESKASDGYFFIRCGLGEDSISRISAIILLSGFYNGIASVEEQYPGFVKLNKRIMTLKRGSADNDTSEKTMTKGRKGENHEG